MMDDGQTTTGLRRARDPFSTHEAMLGWVRDIAPYGIFTTDTRLIIRGWNEWLATRSGLSADEVVGRSLADLFPDLVARGLDQHFERALRGEVAVLATALHRYLLPLPCSIGENPSGRMLQTARIAPLASDDQIVGTLTIIEDVTQREVHAAVLRRQQEYDRLLSESLGRLISSEDPIASVAEIFPRIAGPLRIDVYLHFQFIADEQELRLHSAGGVTAEVKRTLSVLPVASTASGAAALSRRPRVESHVQQSEDPLLETSRRLGLRSYAVFPLFAGDRVFGTLSFGSYVRDAFTTDEVEFLAKIAQYAAIAIDRTQRESELHDAQARLSRHASELETRIAERTAVLHETIAQLESFSYTVAHDLRAPIRSLTSFTDILLNDFAADMPMPAQDMLARLLRASRRLDALTKDLLTFSRVAREEVKLVPIDVDELTREIVSHSSSLPEGAVTVVGPLGRVLAQRTLLGQCLANLFDNAVKFARPGFPPVIQVRSELRGSAAGSPAAAAPNPNPPFQTALSSIAPRATGPRLRVWIEDNGIGIARTDHEKIWGIFERIPGPSAVEGTGIGLAIVARAMQQMGGGCGVESTPGHGSHFWLELIPAPEVTSAA